MEGDALNLWIENRLRPLTRSLGDTQPELFGWLSLSASIIAGGLLYSSYDHPWFALAVVPLLLLRLVFDSLEGLLSEGHLSADRKHSYSQILSRLCGRLADLSVFLGVAFWPDSRIHLALLAIASMLVTSYVGELGRGVGADTSGGLLCKSHRMVLMILFCLIFAFKPQATIMGFSTFEVMFILFIPLASLTMLQRLEVILTELGKPRGQ